MKKFCATIAFFMVFFSSFSGLNRVSSLSFNLKATPECGHITLEWEPVTGADRYYIYRGPGEGLEYETPLTDFPIEETTYKDVTDLVVNQKYCYYVKAVNQEGREFLQSTEACAVFTCKEEIPVIGEKDCKLVLKYQVGNFYYWRNENQKGPMDVEPVLLNSRVLASARYLAEEVGATVGWDATTRTVSIVTLDGNKIQMQIGNPIMLVNDQQVQIDPNNKAVTPIIYKNRTMLPFRALAYNLGATGPDDIVWLGDIKTAVLTFNDGNCNWICGCYIAIHPSTADIVGYIFQQDCNESKRTGLKIPEMMKDALHNWLFSEYVQQYPNQNKWCVEIRLDKDNLIIAWRARPDKYPKCCEETLKTGRLVIQVPSECAEYCKVNIVDDENYDIVWTGKSNSKGIVDTGCILPCSALYHVFVYDETGKCKFDPPLSEIVVPCCPERAILRCECKCGRIEKLCGCLTKEPILQDTGNYLVFIMEKCSDGDPVYDKTIIFPAILYDTNLKVSVYEYYQNFANTNPAKNPCIEVSVNVAFNEAVQWWAYPGKDPCCKEPEEIEWKPGCIRKWSDEDPDDPYIQIVFNPDCKEPTDLILYNVRADLKDTLHGFTFVEYFRKYSEHLYWFLELYVRPNNNVLSWKSRPERHPNFGRSILGRIVFKISEPQSSEHYYLEGVNILVYEGEDRSYPVLTIHQNEMAEYDSGCILKCDGTLYTFIPVKEDYLFYPEEITKIIPCCGDETPIENISATYNKSQVYIHLPSECRSDAVVEVYTTDSTGLEAPTVRNDLLVTLSPNVEGFFDTGCALTNYTWYCFVPKSDVYQFDPPFLFRNTSLSCHYLYYHHDIFFGCVSVFSESNPIKMGSKMKSLEYIKNSPLNQNHPTSSYFIFYDIPRCMYTKKEF